MNNSTKFCTLGPPYCYIEKYLLRIFYSIFPKGQAVLAYNVQTLLKISYFFLVNEQRHQILYFGPPLLLYREIFANEVGNLFDWPTTRKHFENILFLFLVEPHIFSKKKIRMLLV